MIPVFGRINTAENPSTAELAQKINIILDELEACLADITSENISEISTDETRLKSSQGSFLSGDMLCLCGKQGEVFAAGCDKATGRFELYLRDKDGSYIFNYEL